MKFTNIFLIIIGLIEFFLYTKLFNVFPNYWLILLLLSFLQTFFINDIRKHSDKYGSTISELINNAKIAFIIFTFINLVLFPISYSIIGVIKLLFIMALKYLHNFKKALIKHKNYNKSIEVSARKNKESNNTTYRLKITNLKKINQYGFIYINDKKVINSNIDMYVQSELRHIDNLTGFDFERYCTNLLYKLGYSHIIITPKTGDFGLDIIANKGNQKYGFQCKLYAQKVGYKSVQETFTGCQFYNIQNGIIITNNYFTDSVKLAVKAFTFNLILWDRSVLIKLLKRIYYDQMIRTKVIKIRGQFI